MPSVRLASAGALFVLCVLGSAAQQPTAPSTPTIRTTTRLVQVSCVVQGKGRASLPGLTAADFQLFDKGVEQQVAALSMGWVEGPLPDLDAPEEGTYSNRSGLGDEQSPSATVILIDGNYMPNMDEQHVRKHLLKFLETVKPWERIALYTLEDGLRVLHDFSSDPIELKRALESYNPPKKKMDSWASHPWNLFDWPGAPPAFRELQYKVAKAETRHWGMVSLSAIEAVARRMAGFQGRKNLVWITSSVPFELPKSLKEQRGRDPIDTRVVKLARTLQDLNISVYPLNPTVPQFDSYSSGYDSFGSYGTYDYYSGTYSGGAHSIYAVPNITFLGYGYGSYYSSYVWHEGSWADRTGGKAFLHTNNISSALRRALDDARRTYVLGFYPNHGKWDGSFRKLKVKLLNRRGGKVNCRKGYYALPDAPSTRWDLLSELSDATASPLEATGLTVYVQPWLKETPAGLRFEARIHLMGSDLVLDLEDDWWKGRLAVLTVQRDVEGKMLTNRGDIFSVSIPEGAFDALQTQGLRFRISTKLESGAEQMRIIVKDSRGGKLGSVTIPLDGLPRKQGA